MTRHPHQRPDDGFTLIELLVVVVIIGVLAAIAIPSLVGQKSKAQRAMLTADLRNVASAEEAFFVENGAYTTDEAALVLEGFNRSSDVGDLAIAVYSEDGGPVFCVRAAHSASGAVSWLESTSGAVTRSNPNPVSCPT